MQTWSGFEKIGSLASLQKLRPTPLPDGPQVRFNEQFGNLGLIALDNTREASIRFCEVRELDDYTVKPSGRHITKLLVAGPLRIAAWNAFIRKFRERTGDVLLTCYKGIRKDGKYRRRLDWALARGIIHHVH